MASSTSNSFSNPDFRKRYFALEALKQEIERRMLHARIELFNTEFERQSISTAVLTNQVGTFLDEIPQAISVKSPISDHPSQAFHSDHSVPLDAPNKLPPQKSGAFVTLEFARPSYADLVCRHKWSTDQIRSHQGPDCLDHPRWTETCCVAGFVRTADFEAKNAGGKYLVDNVSGSAELQSNLRQALLSNTLKATSGHSRGPEDVTQPAIHQYNSPLDANPSSLKPDHESYSRRQHRAPVAQPSPSQLPLPEQPQRISHLHAQSPGIVTHQQPSQSPSPSLSQNLSSRSGPVSYDSFNSNQDPKTTQHITIGNISHTNMRKCFVESAGPYINASMSHSPGSYGVSPENNAFLHLAAIQGLAQQSQVAQNHYSITLQPTNEDGRVRTFANAVAGLRRPGLAKKPKQITSASPNSTQATPSKIIDDVTNPRKRSLSVEITDQRPRQRRRDESKRILTPPLNGSFIDENYDRDSKSEGRCSVLSDKRSHRDFNTTKIESHITASSAQQHSTKIEIGSNTESTQPSSHASMPKISMRRPNSRNTASSLDRTHSESLTLQDVPASRYSSSECNADMMSRASRQQKDTGTPAMIAERQKASNELDDEDSEPDVDDPRTRRYLRTNARRPMGYYKTKPHRPLAPAERVNLELRFCAQITRIIGTKICVSMAPLPYDSIPIFDRLKSRFRAREDDEFGDDHYRSSKDFQNDYKRILAQYVKLGRCPECPFMKSGNARVMCYRMRLGTIVDERLGELSEALKACEFDVNANEHDKRCEIIDTWFWEEDFAPDGHWMGG